MLNRQITRRAAAGAARELSRLSEVANDNARLRLVQPSAKAVGRAVPGRLVRLNPWIGLGLLAWNYLSNAEPEGWNDLGPWTKYATIPPGLINPLRSVQWGAGTRSTVANSATIANFVNKGLDGQAVQNIGDPWAAVANSSRSFGLGMTDGSGPTARMQYREAYTRPNTGAFTKPTYRPAKAPIVLPLNNPDTWHISHNAHNAKPNEAPAFPYPIPYNVLPRLNPAASPNRAVSYGLPNQSPVPDADFYPQTVNNNWSVQVQTPAPEPNTAPRTHTLSPPVKRGDSGTKERKTRLSPAISAILKGVSKATEGVDFVNALYDALPPQYRPRYRKTKHEKRAVTPQEKMKALWENADKIDISEAIENLISNQIEDYVYGKIGQQAGRNSELLGRQYGFGQNTIMRDLSKSWYDFETRASNVVAGEQ